MGISMKQFKQMVIIIFTALVLAFNTTGAAYAADTSAANQPGTQSAAVQSGASDEGKLTDRQKLDYVSNMLSQIIELINDRYVGDKPSIEQLYEAALKGITSTLDQYSEYFTEEELSGFIGNVSSQLYGVGVSITSNEAGEAFIARVVDGSPAKRAGMAMNDVLLYVNSVSVEGMNTDNIRTLIAEKDELTMTVRRGTEIKTFTMTKERIFLETVYVNTFDKLVKAAEDNNNSAVRYVYINTIGENTGKEFIKAINAMKESGVKKIVLDLRGNPGGYMDTTMEICNAIVPKGPIIHTVNSRDVKKVLESDLEQSPFEQIVVLVNRGTASAAEVIASALQDSKAATIVGETTYGKGVIQSLYNLPDGGGLKFTTEEYFRRNGEKLNTIGVIPDIIIKMPSLVTKSVKLTDDKKSDEIPKLKALLAYLGHKVGANDNVYDEATRSAVAEFQKKFGIEQTGDLTDETLNAINISVYRKYNEDDLPLAKAYELLMK